jgi:hypothetical protein
MKTISATGELLVDLLARVEVAGRDRCREQYSDPTRSRYEEPIQAIIGGVNSVTGALVGATVITVLNEVMRHIEDGVDVAGLHIKAATGISAAVLGIGLILMLRFRPAGLLSSYELQLGLGASPHMADVVASTSTENVIAPKGR